MEVYFTSLGCLLTCNLLLCLASDFEKFLEGQPGSVTGLLPCLFFLITIIRLSSMHKKTLKALLLLCPPPQQPLPKQSPDS